MSEKKINVDVGLSAKAEITASVPEKSAGRFVDAITDIIRPFSESRGLRADQIRLQREEVLIEIARRARARLAIENEPIQPLPNKFMIPLLEAASNEELDSPLIERWSNLLASAATGRLSPSPRFVSVLAELTGREAELLDLIARNHVKDEVELTRLHGIISDRLLTMTQQDIVQAVTRAANDLDTDDQLEEFVSDFEWAGFCLIHSSAQKKFDADAYFDFHPEIYSDRIEVSFNIMESLSLIDRFETGWIDGEKWGLTVMGYKFTGFGLELWKACNNIKLPWRDNQTETKRDGA